MNSMRSIRFCLLVAISLSTVACAGLFKNYGQINPKDEVTKAFESFQVNPQYRYYTTGSDLHPNAVMGLHRDYTLDPRTTWKEVAMTKEKMKELVTYMYAKAWTEHREFLFGFEMTDDKGKPIGVWYSILSARTFLKMQEDGTVRIDTPELDVYEKTERGPRSPSF